jgi:hypothetical protein
VKKKIYTLLIFTISVYISLFPQQISEDAYTKIILGQEKIEHWTRKDTMNSPDIWKTSLEYKPLYVLSDSEYLQSYPLYSYWEYRSWYWENGTLYLKAHGNPDNTNMNVNAVKNVGGAVTSSGDFNGDGIQDIVTMTYKTRDSCCQIFYGNGNISSLHDYTLKAADALWHVSSAGDLNGDRYDDLLLAAGNGIDGKNKVKVYIYYGSENGLDSASKTEISYDYYSYSILVSKHSGDVNNDGFDDVIISTTGPGHPRRFYLYNGKSSGISSNPDQVIELPNSNDGNLGISFIGDINGDSFDDIAVSLGSWPDYISRVRIFYGSAIGLDMSKSQLLEIEEYITDNPYYFGLHISKSKDINNDGIDDLVLGDDMWLAGEGRILIFYGSSDGLSDIPDKIINNPLPENNVRFGEDLDGVGDVNNDGIDDLVVGSPYANNAFIFYGSSNGVLDQNFTILTSGIYYFGFSVSAVGNFFNDCRNSFVVGEEFGTTYLYLAESLIKPDFRIKHFCEEVNHHFYIHSCVHPDSVAWDFGDPASGINNISREIPGMHHYSDTGSFNVELRFYVNDSVSTVKKTIKLKPPSPLTVNLGNDTVLCEGDTIKFDVPSVHGTYLWSDGNTNSERTIDTEGDYWLRVTNVCYSAYDTVNISYSKLPEKLLPQDTVVCRGRHYVPQLRGDTGYSLGSPRKKGS